MIADEPQIETVRRIIEVLRSVKLDLSAEKLAQAELAKSFAQHEIAAEREVRLNEHDIVDFLVGGVGIEIKLRGASKKDVYRQLRRYAQSDRISVLILASNLSIGLPEQIEGKDVYLVKLSEGWL
ncbi:hypothetical protein [Schlesneria sp. T3-172]|uniref:hypothetical protein n=1 Tax=Schlesneria sphaerica TaxID=3373610 RepID=UPI0037CA7A71